MIRESQVYLHNNPPPCVWAPTAVERLVGDKEVYWLGQGFNPEKARRIAINEVDLLINVNPPRKIHFNPWLYPNQCFLQYTTNTIECGSEVRFVTKSGKRARVMDMVQFGELAAEWFE